MMAVEFFKYTLYHVRYILLIHDILSVFIFIFYLSGEGIEFYQMLLCPIGYSVVLSPLYPYSYSVCLVCPLFEVGY